MRGEPEGCPLGCLFLFMGWGRSSAEAMRSEGGVQTPPHSCAKPGNGANAIERELGLAPLR
jgi:hypothetical protein